MEITKEEFIKRMNAFKEEEPDEIDRQMLADIEKREASGEPNESEPLEQYLSRKQYSGKLVIRIPSELHASLSKSARENHVSLNQYILYKLAR